MIYRILTVGCLIVMLVGCGAANVSDTQAPAMSSQSGTTAVPIDTQYPSPQTDSIDAYPMATSAVQEVTSYPAPTVESADTTTAGADTAQDVVAVWMRSGGFAGFQDSIKVYADGRMEIDRNGSVTTEQITPSALQSLKATFASSDWAALQPEYGQQFPDAFAYTIEAGGKTVKTYDAAPSPPILETALQQFADLYSSGQ